MEKIIIDGMEKATRECSAEIIEDMPTPVANLLALAKNWSKASLESYSGTLLRKSLMISAAIADFSSELHHPSAD